MSDRMDFEIVCPNDHDQTVTFSQEEFEEVLKSGALVFHCNTCDTNWPPSHEDIAKIRKQFLHFLANHWTAELLEYSTSKSPLRWNMTREDIPVDADGMVAVPSSPGLGVHINEATLDRYRVTSSWDKVYA